MIDLLYKACVNLRIFNFVQKLVNNQEFFPFQQYMKYKQKSTRKRDAQISLHREKKTTTNKQKEHVTYRLS